MEGIQSPADFNASVSSSSPQLQRGPCPPTLARIVVGERHKHLDLVWVEGERDRGGDRTTRRTIVVLLRGRCIAPPARLPDDNGDDSGRNARQPLSGKLTFQWAYVRGGVWRLRIEQPDNRWTSYYCNLHEPPDAEGWQRSYRLAREAYEYDLTMAGDVSGTSMSRARLESPPDSYDSLIDGQPGEGLRIERRARVRSAPALRPPSSPVRASSPQPPPGPVMVRDKTSAMVQATRLMPAIPVDFTPQEARYRLNRLRNSLDERSRLVAGAYLGDRLVAVVQEPQRRWSWFRRDPVITYNERIYRTRLHRTWDVGNDARILGGGPFPPTKPGESTTLETCESFVGGGTVIEWAIDAEGQPVASINERPATFCKPAT